MYQKILLNRRRPLKPGQARTALCHEGYYYILVLAFVITGSILREINLLVVLAGMMLGPLLINWRVALRGLRGMSVERRLPAAVAAGDLLEVRLNATKAADASRRGRPAHGVLIEDEITRLGTENESEVARVLIWQVAPGSSVDAVYRVRLCQRGRYAFGPLTLSSRFPLGLIRRTIDAGQRRELVVFPRIGTLRSGWLKSLQDTFRGERFSHLRPGGAQGEFHRLREWRAGDMQRWIHWRTTARRGTPIVREFEMPSEPNYAIVLDLSPPDDPPLVADEVIERAVSFAATLAAEVCRTGGARLALAACRNEPEVRAAAVSQHFLRELLAMLADCERTAEDHLPQLLRGVLARVEYDTHVVLVTLAGDRARRVAEQVSAEGDARHRRLAERLTVIDATSQPFDDLFQYEPLPQDTPTMAAAEEVLP